MKVSSVLYSVGKFDGADTVAKCKLESGQTETTANLFTAHATQEMGPRDFQLNCE